MGVIGKIWPAISFTLVRGREVFGSLSTLEASKQSATTNQNLTKKITQNRTKRPYKIMQESLAEPEPEDEVVKRSLFLSYGTL